MSRDPITTAVERNLCTGCGACAGAFPNAIKMLEDPIHGRRPTVAPTATGRRAAEQAIKLCAGVQSDWTSLQIKDDIDATWGPVLATWEAAANDSEIRHHGSSGGAVTALALFALNSGKVQGVAHVVARSDDPRLNKTAISTNRSQLMRGTGSRYAQASPAEILGDIAAGKDKVMFVGKPCDVAAASRASKSLPGLAENMPLTISIFCAGAPTLTATQTLLQKLDVPKTGKLVELRYRGKGWPGLMQARWKDDKGDHHDSKGIPYAEGWGRHLQASRRWRCRICADHTGAFGDISIGDPWHAPPAGDTDPGRSLIVARTERGRAFVEAAIRAGVLSAEERPRDIIGRAQPNLVATNGAVWGRLFAMQMIGMRTPQMAGQMLFYQWMALTKRQKMQSILGTWKRVLRDRLWQRVRLTGASQ